MSQKHARETLRQEENVGECLPVAATRRSLETMLGMRSWYMPTVTSSKKKPARKMFIGDAATVKSGCTMLYCWLLPTSAAALATAVKAVRSRAGQLLFSSPCKYLHRAASCKMRKIHDQGSKRACVLLLQATAHLCCSIYHCCEGFKVQSRALAVQQPLREL